MAPGASGAQSIEPGNHSIRRGPLRTLVQAGLRPAALVLIVAALLWLAASWLPFVAPNGALASQRPLALLLLGLGVVLRWLQAPRAPQPLPRSFELSTFKYSTIIDDQGPDTHPISVPTSAEDDAAGSDDTPAQPAPATAAKSGPTPPKRPARWQAGLTRAIEWQRFEALCMTLFRQDGFVTKLYSRGTAGEVEIWLHPPIDMKNPERIVLCKHVSDAAIDGATVTRFQAALQAAKVTSGAIVTAGRFSDEAKQLARSNNISPIDGVKLLSVILRRTEEQQQELLEIATQGEYWRPTCPGCDNKMTQGDGEKGAWTCTRTAACPGVLSWIPEAV
jgi:restriction system protein